MTCLKTLFHPWAIWAYKKNVVFRNNKCNPYSVLELAKKLKLGTINAITFP